MFAIGSNSCTFNGYDWGLLTPFDVSLIARLLLTVMVLGYHRLFKLLLLVALFRDSLMRGSGRFDSLMSSKNIATLALELV